MPASSNLVNRRIAEFVMKRQALFHQADSPGYEENMTPFTDKFVVFGGACYAGPPPPSSRRDRLHQARNQPVRLRFGPFEIDRVAGRLYKRGVPLHIENHPFLVLEALLERPDDIVTREELQQRIWGAGTNVGFEDGLNTAVRKLRFALGDSSDSPLFIETIPKRGYRFVAPLSEGKSEGKSGANDGSPARPDDAVQIRPDEAIQFGEDPSQDLSQTPARNVPWVASLNRRGFVAAVAVLIAVPIAAIAGLLFWRHGRPQRVASSFSAIQARRLEGVHTREAVALSPDGRYVAYTRWDGEMSSIRLRQVANAGEVEILPSRKTNYVGLTFSPDGNELYFVSSNEGNPHYRSLYRMPALGGPTQKLIEDIDSPVSFSPDGRRFVFARFRAATSTLEVRTANADGSGEELFTQFPGYAWGCFLPRAAWSPDGRTIAIPFRGTVTPRQSSLYSVDVATRKVEEVYSGSGCIGHPAWTPDKALIFSRAGDLWMVLQRKLLEKGSIGGIRRLAGYGGSLAEQMDTSRDGKTAVATGDQSSKGLWAVPVQPVSPAKQLISGDVALSSVDELVDGRILVTKDDSTIWTTKVDSGDWQRLANVSGSAMSCGQFVVVRTDDGSLVRFSADGTGGRILARGPAKTPTCSLKGDAVFYVMLDQPQQVMRVPIDGGNPVTIAKIREGELVTLRISPDGNFLAYAFYSGSKPDTRLSLSVLRASDGGLVNATEEAKLGAWDFYWSPDGKALDYVSAEDEWTDVWEKPFAGGEPRRITHFRSGEVSDFRWSRDGKRLLVVWGPTSDDVVLLSGLQ
jgi:DNA-binding winged helix-turn-helix (wHTH) protein/Tol biopolymer transport system component